ncbi:hypothetical protein PV327_003202 [Microctonus hyperodae]|uniref:TIL domain-containing protein n=1 Tax=Microctonus hyperodae TaxID=165561 RepID=A0AA39L0U3_MICHY|nr:hypothetical protein PV327_003202 [Microctonus hyperodae]
MPRNLTIAIFLASLTLIYAHCHKKCGENESIDICGHSCEPRCGLRDLIAVQCITCSAKTRGCRCNSGFLRDEETGYCVDPENCTKCNVGENHLACGRICEGTCASPTEPKKCQLIRCAKQGCRCDLNEGYVRDTESGRCVLISDCPASE